MSKMLNIALVDVDGPLHMPAYCMDWSTLSEEECSNILHAMNFHHPTEEEVYNARNESIFGRDMFWMEMAKQISENA